MEREAEVAKHKAVKELERRWEERQGMDKGRIEKVGVTERVCFISSWAMWWVYCRLYFSDGKILCFLLGPSINQEVRQKQVLGTAHQLEAMQREKAATLSSLEGELSAQANAVCEAARREFWAAQGEALRGLERLREACVERIRQEVKAQVGEVGLRPVEEVVGTQLGDVRQRVLRRMQKGSFLAEEEYARLLEAEPKIRDAQVRGWREAIGGGGGLGWEDDGDGGVCVCAGAAAVCGPGGPAGGAAGRRDAAVEWQGPAGHARHRPVSPCTGRL